MVCPVCGQMNEPAETFCGECGEEQPAAATLQPGDSFAGFEVLAQVGARSFAVRTGKGGDCTAGRLEFAQPKRADDVAATLRAFDPVTLQGEASAAVVPRVIASGNDRERGAYVVLEHPAGNWKPLDTVAPLSPAEAAIVLLSLAHAAEQAARAGRLLLLSPAQVMFDGERVFLPSPIAPALPLTSPLLADPAFVPPELRTGQRDVAAWPASAYAVGATVRAVTGAALGFPPRWRTVLALLLADDPALRPASAAEVAEALAGADRPASVAVHRTAFRTDAGRHHTLNQDAGGVWSWERWDGTPVTLAVVADGVSAGVRSEEAAALAVTTLHAAIDAHWRDREFDADRAVELLISSGIEANRRITSLPARTYEEASASTLVAVCLIGGTAVGIWCGDSRAYGFTPAGCRALTRDHSWVNAMIDSGRMTAVQAAGDRRARVITRWLGVSEPPQLDPGFDCFRCELAPGDRLLVCSDGLSMYFDDPVAGEAALTEIVYRRGDDVASAVNELVQAALERGGRDNITAALVATL